MSTRQLYNQKIKKIIKEFIKIRPDKIILFGSLLKRNIDEDADIDICVIKKTADRLKTKRELRDIIWRRKIGFDPEIDVHVYSPEVYHDFLKRRDPFIEEIEKGKILYDKRSAHRTI